MDECGPEKDGSLSKPLPHPGHPGGLSVDFSMSRYFLSRLWLTILLRLLHQIKKLLMEKERDILTSSLVQSPSKTPSSKILSLQPISSFKYSFHPQMKLISPFVKTSSVRRQQVFMFGSKLELEARVSGKH